MKRYLLFIGETFYPSGGWNDFVDSFATLQEAKDAAVEPEKDTVTGWFYNIVDSQTGQMIEDEWGLDSRWVVRRRMEIERDGVDPNALVGDEEALNYDGSRRVLPPRRRTQTF